MSCSPQRSKRLERADAGARVDPRQGPTWLSRRTGFALVPADAGLTPVSDLGDSREVDIFRTRGAVPGDLPAVRCLFRRSSLSNEGDRAALLTHPEALILAADGIAEGRTRVAVTIDGTIVGFATVLPHENSTLELEDLFVDPDWMRRGIATRLIADLVEQARRSKIQHIWVTANPHAYDFYRSVGFTHVRKVETEFGRGSHMELSVADEAVY